MAEEIVACPGCAKKFRIPEGAPPGAFPCTACGVSVPYGAPAAAAKGGAKPAAHHATAARPAARPAASAARQAAPARAAAPQRASAARAEPPRSRRSARDDDEAPKKSNQGLIWGGIVVGGGALILIVWQMTKPAAPTPAPTPAVAAKPADKPKPPAPKPEPAKPAEAPKPAASEPAAAAPSTAPAPAPAPSTDESKPAASAPAPAPKPADAPKPAASSTSFATLGSKVASVAGVTDEERATFDKYVALVMDQFSAKEGAEAEAKLVRAGKKAIPSILTAFGNQSAGKWTSDADQWSADRLQDLLHRISGADGLNQKDDFWPKFQSGATTEDFQKAANLWFNWWNNKGQAKDKYKPRSD